MGPKMKTMDLGQRSLLLIQMIRLHRQRLQRRKLKQWCETRFRSPFHSESPPWTSSSLSLRKYHCLAFSQPLLKRGEFFVTFLKVFFVFCPVLQRSSPQLATRRL